LARRRDLRPRRRQDQATARLSDKDANRLLLRGYVGVPMFGRTEEWTREPAPAGDPCRDPGAG
jgi:hypothetical protein